MILASLARAEMPCHAAPPACTGGELDYAALRSAGREFLEQGKDEDALLCYRRARAICETGDSLWNEALTLERLGHFDEALDLYELAARNYPENLADANASRYFEGVSNLRARVGVVAVTANVADYEIYVDDRLRPSHDRLVYYECRVVGGEPHVVRIAHPEFKPFEQSVTVAPGGRIQLSVTLVPNTGGWVQFEDRGSTGPTSVVLDGRDEHSLPWGGRVTAGKHTIWTRGVRSGSPPKVLVVKDGTLTRMALESMPLGAPTLLEIDPPEASVELDGAALPRDLRRLVLPPGTFQLVISAPRHRTIRQQLEVGPDGPEHRVRIELPIDETHSSYSFGGYGFLAAHGGLAISPTLNGDITADCPGSCAASSLPIGAVAGLRGGYRFRQGLAPELHSGFLMLSQSVDRTVTSPFGNDRQYLARYDLHDELRLRGFYLGPGGSYHRPVIPSIDLVARFGFGIAFLWAGDAVTGTVRSADTHADIDPPDNGAAILEVAGYLWPEIGAVLTLSRFELGLSLGAQIILGNGPDLPGRQLSATAAAQDTCMDQTDPKFAGCAPKSTAISGERPYRPFVVLLPQLSLAYRFR